MRVEASSFGTDHPGLYGVDEEFNLYYDETNNIRKLRLKEGGLSDNKSDNFVLGGIVLKPGQSIGDIKELRDILHIQKSAVEIKFDLIAKGNFESILESRKLSKVFTWLLDRDIGIHFVNLNILNWSILDIIESVMASDEFADIRLIHRELKNELYRIAVTDLPAFLVMLNAYGYPNIQRDATGAFLGDVNKFIQRNLPSRPNHATPILIEVLSKARSLPELAFLVDERDGMLIDGFESFFLSRICMFKNARHVFDEEKEVQKQMGHFQIMDGARQIDFSFVDSKTVGEIQLSDVVVGFLGKYFSYIEKTPASVLLRKRKNLSSTQSHNLKLFKKLIDTSDTTSNALLHRVTTMDSDWKNEAFLYGTSVPPHLVNS